VDRPSEREIAAWYPRLFRTALRLTGNAEDAADLTQQTFYRALQTWDRFDGKALPTTWLHQILVNGVRDWARRRAVRAARQIDEWDLLPVAAEACGGRERLEKREELAVLRQAIESLPAAARTALVATVLDGYTYQEAAEMLQVPLGTIASRVYQARAQLRATLGEALGEVEP